MNAASPPASGGFIADWRAAAADWTLTAAPGWLHVGKTFGAAILVLWLAMRLELPQPRTAMLTVFIVMQPHSGAVLAKSFYRIGGTVIGSLVALSLVALFPQEHALFLLAITCWLALCTAGATRNRNFRSYGFVLAGYTAALIGIPTIDDPSGIFIAAVTRLTEVSLGVIVSTVVSAVVFPQHVSNSIPRVVRARFTSFVEFVSDSLSGRIDRAGIEASNLRFISDVINLEAARSMGVFENPEIRLRSGRLTQLNSDFMAVSTRLHALHQTLNRLRTRDHAEVRLVLDAFEPYLREIAQQLNPAETPVLQASDAGAAAHRLDLFRLALPARIAGTRVALTTQEIGALILLDFDTAAELFYRFVDELHAYTATYASLAETLPPVGIATRPYVPKTGLFATTVSGLRAALALFTVCFFWYATAWPSGGLATIFGGVVCAISATAINPFRTAYQMLLGAIIALPAGAVAAFILAPQADGFAMLAVVLAPFLIAALCLSTKPRWAGVGIGFLLFFGFGAVPDNPVVYNPVGFFNDLIAIIIATGLSAAAFGVILPPTSGWWLKRIVRDLRQQVVAACIGRREEVKHSFESASRDLMYQAGALIEDRPDAQQVALAWMFVTLEVGHAMIELRSETAALVAEAAFARQGDWPKPLWTLRDDMVRLFDKPTVANRRRALASTATAIAHVQQKAGDMALAPLHESASGVAPAVTEAKLPGMTDERVEPRLSTTAATVATALPVRQRQRLLRLVSYLHFMRSALLDPRSPLPGGGDFRETPIGEPHAS